ncbi:MAG: ATPase central domain protein [Myxococcales bacterium]|nr:ATPase central domain protein [Myxococcales bacterium]
MAELPQWLAAIIAEVRLHAEAALIRRLDAGSGFADPRVPSQIYLRDEAALARIAGGTLRPQGTHRKAAAELERAIASAAHDARQTRLGVMTSRLGIDPIAGGLLVAALAYAIDLDTREIVHALTPRRRPALYLETCADVLAIEPAALVMAIASGSALRRGRILLIDGDGLGAAIALSGSALAWLLGDDALQPPVAGTCELVTTAVDLGVALPAAVLTALDALVARVAAAPEIAVVLRGPRGSGRRAAAHRLARALGRPLIVIPIPVLLIAERRMQTTLLGAALAAARLRDAVPYLAEADALYDESGNLAAEHADAIAAMPGVVVVASSGRGGHLDLRRPQLAVAMPRAELDDRERAWLASLDAHRGPKELAAELAARYVIGPGAIADVVVEAGRYAVAAGVKLDRDALEGAVGRRLSLRLGTFGTVVTRKALMAELVLPEETIETLRDMISMVRERAQILERWGYQRHLGISRGVAGLYSGEPGTGKTMAASVVASELGLELVRIDLSAVVSKYVGETEKNLGKIFDEAQDAHAMLLFDEADSLFGKRTELKTAQDRFANLEVNYILQRMETFDGVSVLTTNAEASIDPALQRRLNFRIRFPEPEVDEREKLWRQLLPPATNLHERVDFRALAERFEMTGGYIKNAVVRAAVVAARAGRAMVAEDLWIGAHHEYIEMGKVMPQLPGNL